MGTRLYFHPNYFQNNLNDLKSTCKGRMNLISLKELPNAAPSNTFDNGGSLTEPQEILNAFQNILLTLLLTLNLVLDTQKIIFMIF